VSASSDAQGAQRLPRGRHGLSRDFVTENQRERIFDSLAAVSAAHGYAEVRVQDITEHAGVSRRTFYDLFADKEQCFLAAYELIMERLIGEVSAAYAAGDRPWPERVATALRALIQRYASEPDLARLAMVEVLAAGRAALERRDAALRRFATFLDPGKAGLPAEMEGTEVLTQAVIGGLYEALYTYIVDGHTEQLPALVPDVLYCVLVPYLGHAQALAASDAARLEPPRELAR
jgi:AcrR family transcriptional regulator